MHLCNRCGVIEFGLGKAQHKEHKVETSTKRVMKPKREHKRPSEWWKVAPKSLKPLVTSGETTWSHNGTKIRAISIKVREDGSHVRTVCVTGVKKQRFRYLCNSDINHRKTQYGLLGYAQVSSCSCFHCYSHYMGRQWSNDLRTKISNAIRHGKNYDKYEPLIGINREELMARLMEKMRMRYGIAYYAVTWDEIVSGRYKFQIDEIIPRQVLYIEENINDVDQWTRIFNQKNFQLLTKKDNDAKGARIEHVKDLEIFRDIYSTEGAREVIIKSRLDWIQRRTKRGLELLDTEREFFEIHGGG